MPVGYQFPNWVRGADPIEALSAGAAVGERRAALQQSAAAEANRTMLAMAQMDQEAQQFNARLAQQGAALQSQEQQAMLEMETKTKLIQDQRQREDAQHAIQNAMAQAHLGLAKDAFAAKAKLAADAFAAKQKYQSLAEGFRSQGFSDAEAAMKAGMMVPEMGAHLAPIASLLREEERLKRPITAPATFPLEGTTRKRVFIGPGGQPHSYDVDQPGGSQPEEVETFKVPDPNNPGKYIPGAYATRNKAGGFIIHNVPRGTSQDRVLEMLGKQPGDQPSSVLKPQAAPAAPTGAPKVVSVRMRGDAAAPVPAAPAAAPIAVLSPTTLDMVRHPTAYVPPTQRPAPAAPQPSMPTALSAKPVAEPIAEAPDWRVRTHGMTSTVRPVSGLRLGDADLPFLRDGNKRDLKAMGNDQLAVDATTIFGRQYYYDPKTKSFYILPLPGEGVGMGQKLSRTKLENLMLERSVDQRGGFEFSGE